MTSNSPVARNVAIHNNVTHAQGLLAQSVFAQACASGLHSHRDLDTYQQAIASFNTKLIPLPLTQNRNKKRETFHSLLHFSHAFMSILRFFRPIYHASPFFRLGAPRRSTNVVTRSTRRDLKTILFYPPFVRTMAYSHICFGLHYGGLGY